MNNLIFTDYLSFHFYRDGEKNGDTVAIGKIEDGSIVALPENFATFTDRLKDFCAAKGTQTIRSSKKLSAMMAGKARLLSNIIELALNSDATHNEDSTLKDQMEAFKDILIHDITAEGFADIYAQTITYGMFAARLHDPTLPTFSRQEAAELIPKSNPFLRKLFGYIAGPDLDSRIKWIVDDLVEIFLACNVAETYAYCLLKNHFHLLIRTRSEEEILKPKKKEIFAKGDAQSEDFLKESEKKSVSWHLSNSFASLFKSYAQAINIAHKRTGRLFEEPFRRVLVDNDAYFTELIYYIRHNSQKHGFVKDFRDYPHSSYHSHLHTALTKLKREEVL